MTPETIHISLDEREIISQDLKDNKTHTRPEMDPSKPLGMASWRTKDALRDLRLRRL